MRWRRAAPGMWKRKCEAVAGEPYGWVCSSAPGCVGTSWAWRAQPAELNLGFARWTGCRWRAGGTRWAVRGKSSAARASTSPQQMLRGARPAGVRVRRRRSQGGAPNASALGSPSEKHGARLREVASACVRKRRFNEARADWMRQRGEGCDKQARFLGPPNGEALLRSPTSTVRPRA
jgi:hypothetical protein